jgi:prepilin-type processing-associated H-X9-DG protein
MLKRYCRSGFTIIETLVVLFVIVILIAMVIFAVQQARETSRNVVCKHHLHQIGVACQLYESTYQCLPGYDQRGMVQITPLIGGVLSGVPRGASLLDSCLSLDCSDILRPTIGVCPSDEMGSRTVRAISYRFCRGLRDDPTVTGVYGVSPGPISSRGTGYEPVRLVDVTDGLANTSLLSERLIPLFATCQSLADSVDLEDRIPAGSEINRFVWTTLEDFGSSGRADEFVAGCRREFLHHRPEADNCFFDQYNQSYDNTAPPNSRSCFSGEPSGGPGLRPASSRHPGGVNVLICDGSVRFVTDQIEINIWRALGTRNGSD